MTVIRTPEDLAERKPPAIEIGTRPPSTDDQAYEAWAGQADAITMPLSLAETLALARATVRSWGRN